MKIAAKNDDREPQEQRAMNIPKELRTDLRITNELRMADIGQVLLNHAFSTSCFLFTVRAIRSNVSTTSNQFGGSFMRRVK